MHTSRCSALEATPWPRAVRASEETDVPGGFGDEARQWLVVKVAAWPDTSVVPARRTNWPARVRDPATDSARGCQDGLFARHAPLGACAAEVVVTGEAISGVAFWPEHGSSSVIRLRHGGSRRGASRATCSRFIRVHGLSTSRVRENWPAGLPGQQATSPCIRLTFNAMHTQSLSSRTFARPRN